MLNDYLKNRIAVAEKVDSWQESIQIAAAKLIEDKCITKAYVDSMISNIVNNGPYVVITPQVAIPHSRPEEGVIDTAISMLKLNTPIKYPEDKEVALIFVLAARDSDSHMDLIGELVDLLQDKNKLKKIMVSKTASEIKKALL